MNTSGMRRVVGVALTTAWLAMGTAWAETGSQVETCPRKLGVMAVAEPQSGWGYLQQYGLGSPAALLRMMVQQSGCFDVVERGVAMQNLQQERALAQGGDLRQESNVGKGQMQAADFVMTPNVQIGSSTTGGVGGALLGKLGGQLGLLAGGLKFKEASTSLLVADVRSSIQVASAEGKASKTEFSVGGWGFGVPGGLGGYTSTPEGKMVAASLLDNYNRIVQQVRDQPQLIRASSASGDANAAASTRAEAPQPAGQMLVARIANVKVYEQPSRESKVVATLQRSDELIATGESRNGFAQVDAANFSGWVQRTLVQPGAGSAQPAPAPLPVNGAGQPGAALLGSYSGSFNGADQGSFSVTVSAGGVVSGQGTSNATGYFGITGRVDGSGAVQMSSAGASGNAGSATFVGRFDAGAGSVSGTWRLARGNGGGSFSGQRSQ
jgi:curli biogenesis system outer membrane secretion channel CsgG